MSICANVLEKNKTGKGITSSSRGGNIGVLSLIHLRHGQIFPAIYRRWPVIIRANFTVVHFVIVNFQTKTCPTKRPVLKWTVLYIQGCSLPQTLQVISDVLSLVRLLTDKLCWTVKPVPRMSTCCHIYSISESECMGVHWRAAGAYLKTCLRHHRLRAITTGAYKQPTGAIG